MIVDRLRLFTLQHSLWPVPDFMAGVIAGALVVCVVVWFNDFRLARDQEAEFGRRLARLFLGVASIGTFYVAVRFAKWAWSLEF